MSNAVEEIGEYIGYTLENLPADSKDKLFIQGLYQIVDAYLGTASIVQTHLIATSEEKHERFLEEQREQGLLPETFGQRLAFYRNTLGMKQAILARRVGLSPSHLSRIEGDKRRPPAVEYIITASKELRLPFTHTTELLQMAGYSPEALQQTT